jgi:transposase-like protein
MKAMARQRSHSIAFKRQVAQEFIAGESLYALSKRHDISRQLIRVWVERYEAGALDEDAQAVDLLQEYEAKIVALERMVGRQEISPGLALLNFFWTRRHDELIAKGAINTGRIVAYSVPK